MAAGESARSLRYRGKRGLLNAGTNIEEMERTLRARNGRFIKRTLALAQVNEQLALELAQSTADAQRERQLRKKVSTARLHDALMDPRNRHSDEFGFGVGKVSFLTKSQAKYWRQIDQGTTIHVDRHGTVVGAFGGTVKGTVNGYPKALAPWSEMGTDNQQRLRPVSGMDAGLRRRLNRAGMIGRMEIKQPIDPQNYFERGWEAFDAHKAARRIIDHLFPKGGG